ncbi:MAG: type II toxin-antitoxin system RelE/ParE family toxin [Cryobacterium sp.]|nr:type II toxin-antitoxin system RelE/ParE family toxin [Cryobacterium sp.]
MPSSTSHAQAKTASHQTHPTGTRRSGGGRGLFCRRRTRGIACSGEAHRVSDAYEVVFSRSARRALKVDLPEKIPAAAFKSITGALRENPRRVGKPLREPLASLYSARRDEHRVIYRIVDHRLVIDVVSIAHRRDAYLSR